jgi:hypothetical protein
MMVAIAVEYVDSPPRAVITATGLPAETVTVTVRRLADDGTSAVVRGATRVPIQGTECIVTDWDVPPAVRPTWILSCFNAGGGDIGGWYVRRDETINGDNRIANGSFTDGLSGWISSAGLVEGPELLVNGGAEDGLTGWSGGEWYSAATDHHTGTHFFTGAPDGGAMSQTVAVSSGRHTLSAWVGHPSAVSAQVTVAPNAGEPVMVPLTASSDWGVWTETTAEVTIPDGATSAVLSISSSGDWCRIDDLSLRTVAAAWSIEDDHDDPYATTSTPGATLTSDWCDVTGLDNPWAYLATRFQQGSMSPTARLEFDIGGPVTIPMTASDDWTWGIVDPLTIPSGATLGRAVITAGDTPTVVDDAKIISRITQTAQTPPVARDQAWISNPYDPMSAMLVTLMSGTDVETSHTMEVSLSLPGRRTHLPSAVVGVRGLGGKRTLAIRCWTADEAQQLENLLARSAVLLVRTQEIRHRTGALYVAVGEVTETSHHNRPATPEATTWTLSCDEINSGQLGILVPPLTLDKSRAYVAAQTGHATPTLDDRQAVFPLFVDAIKGV